MATSIGMYFWILLFCMMWCIYKKKYKQIIYMLPILFLWITSIAGPVVEVRYVYSMILITPLFIGLSIFSKEKIDNN